MNTKLEKQVDQQKKIIEYLQKKFKETTGREVEVPQSWEQFLSITPEESPIVPLQKQISKRYDIQKRNSDLNFNEAVANLNLPQKLQQVSKKGGGKKKLNSTSFEPTNPYHMVEMINLSGFQFRKFSKARFRQMLECIADMRCLRALVLQDNGIGDSHLEELQQLFTNKRITRIDLSKNKIERASATLITKLLVGNSNHIQWLDLSRNPFSKQTGVVYSLVNALKIQTKLFHCCLDVQDPGLSPAKVSGDYKELVNHYLKLANCSKPPLSSMGLIDTKLFQLNAKQIEAILEAKDCSLNCLNIQFCFPDYLQVESIFRTVRFNNSLIKLDVSNNALGAYSGTVICEALRDNITLAQLYAKSNQFNDEVAYALSEMLAVNATLVVFDIGNNPIGAEGAEHLIRVLSDKNDSLESLGDLNRNLEMGIINIEKIKKLLKGNSISINYKERTVKQSCLDNEPLQYESRESKLAESYQNQYNDYTLLKPIVFTNPLNQDPYSFRLWNI